MYCTFLPEKLQLFIVFRYFPLKYQLFLVSKLVNDDAPQIC